MSGLRGFGYLLTLAGLALASAWFLARVQSSLDDDLAARDAPRVVAEGLRSISLSAAGRPDYILTAPRAEQLAGERGSELQRPQLETFLADRTPLWRIAAGRGWLAPDSDRAVFRDGVVMERSGDQNSGPPLTVTTAVAVWHPREQRVEGDQPLRLDTPGGWLQGVGFEATLDQRRLQLRGQVVAEYEAPR